MKTQMHGGQEFSSGPVPPEIRAGQRSGLRHLGTLVVLVFSVFAAATLQGTVFKLNTDGSGFSILQSCHRAGNHHFR